MYIYIPKGVCTKKISFEIESNMIKNVTFYSGCPGSQEAISKLIDGMSIEKVISTLKGINCKQRGTSCPDQLVKAIEYVLNVDNAEDLKNKNITVINE